MYNLNSDSKLSVGTASVFLTCKIPGTMVRPRRIGQPASLPRTLPMPKTWEIRMEMVMINWYTVPTWNRKNIVKLQWFQELLLVNSWKQQLNFSLRLLIATWLNDPKSHWWHCSFVLFKHGRGTWSLLWSTWDHNHQIDYRYSNHKLQQIF